MPKTLYKPELKILKRSSPELVGAPVAPTAGSCGGVEETEKERRERERKEKERRYKEARERIMGDNVAAASGVGKSETVGFPDGAAESAGNGKGKKGGNQKNGKRSPESNNTPQRTPKSSNRTSPRNSSPAARSPSTSRAPSRKPSPPRPSGAITGFSLNGGAFAAAPVPQTNNRYYAQKELDGKLLESQLHAGNTDDGGHQAHLTAETDAEGLDWDSFSRDTNWPKQQQQQQTAWNGAHPQGWTGQQSQPGGYYQSGVEYAYATAGASINGGPTGCYGGYDYQTAATGAYDYIPQLPPRQQNPGIYGAAATADFPPSRYAAGYGHPDRQSYADKQPQPTYSEKASKQPGAGQAGVQAVRAPRGPDADGSRGFKGRGGKGIVGVVERMGGLNMEPVAGAETWGGV